MVNVGNDSLPGAFGAYLPTNLPSLQQLIATTHRLQQGLCTLIGTLEARVKAFLGEVGEWFHLFK